MNEKANDLNKKTFKRSLFGYNRKSVNEYIWVREQEHAAYAADSQSRLELLTQENERVAQALAELQEKYDTLLANDTEYRKQLKESREGTQTLQKRLELVTTENEVLQSELRNAKKTLSNQNDSSLEEWKQRALQAEEAVRRFAEAELKENGRERDPAPKFRFSFGKKHD